MIVLCGKTASGKSSIAKKIESLNSSGIKQIVTYTSRPPREGEVDGEDYFFITEEEFLQKIEEGFFAEYSSYTRTDGTMYYGSALHDYLGNNNEKIIVLNPDGLKKIRAVKDIKATVFYIIADGEMIWNRLRKRGDDAEEARRRLNADDEDFKDIEKYIDFAIRNDGNYSIDIIAHQILQIYRSFGYAYDYDERSEEA